MTWTTAITDGSCNFGLWFEVVGFGVFGSVDHTPSDSWCNEYSTEGRVYPWLNFDSLDGWREEIDFLDATLKVTGINPEITDVGGGLTALFKNYRTGSYTRLAAELTSAATTATVDSAGAFSTSGVIWVGTECCKYTGKTGTTFTGLTRGYLGTQAVDHQHNLDVLPPRKPVVADNPATLTGRRCYLHFATFSHETGDYSATEIIYRGRVRKGSKVEGGLYTIPVEHISAGMKQKIGRGLGEAKLAPNRYVFSGDSDSLNWVGFERMDNTGSFSVSNLTMLEVDAGQYDPESLLDALKESWRAEYAGNLTDADTPNMSIEDERLVIKSGTAANTSLRVQVKKYDPLWCLGFDPGLYGQNIDSDGIAFKAQNDPRLMMVEVGGEFTLSSGDHHGQMINLSSAVTYIPGEGYPVLRVKSTGDSDVKLSATSAVWPENLGRTTDQIVVDNKKNLVLRDAIRLEGSVVTILKQCFGFEATPVTTASHYFASGLLTTDFDFPELSSALAGSPGWLYSHRHLVTQEVEVQSLVAPSMAMLGACPRITDSAKIGFASITAPTELETNEVEVDDDVWANIEAARIASHLNATPLVNVISVGINKDFQKKNEPDAEVNCFHLDGLNELGETKRLRYDSMIKETVFSRSDDIAERLNERFTSVQFPIFGRESATVEIPCTWKAKNIKCGDLVKITHELIYDLPRGTIGVEDAMGLVVGRRVSIASGNDILRIRIFSGSPWKAVAPTAKATSYNTTAAWMHCTSIDLYSMNGETDFTGFTHSTAFNVHLYPYNSNSAWSMLATVTSVDASLRRIYFSSRPLYWMEWTTAGYWVQFADWDSRTSSATDGYAYIAQTTQSATLGTTGSDPHRWGP